MTLAFDRDEHRVLPTPHPLAGTVHVPSNRPPTADPTIDEEVRSRTDSLVEGIAAEYVEKLRDLNSPLIATDEIAAERAAYARNIVRAVLVTLHPHGSCTEVPSEPHRMVTELANARVRPTVALSAAALLFDTALHRLDASLEVPTVHIASQLARQLLAGIALILDTLGVVVRPEDLVAETIDRSRLHAALTSREAAIFNLLVAEVRTPEIATRLKITETTVKHHITSIGHKLGGRGRVELMKRARELGILVAVPATAAYFATAALISSVTG